MTPLFEELIRKSELTEQEILEMTRDDFQELVRHPDFELDVVARTKLLREWKENSIVPDYPTSVPSAAIPVTPTSSMTRTTIEILDDSDDDEGRKPAATVNSLSPAKKERDTVRPEHVQSKGQKDDCQSNTRAESTSTPSLSVNNNRTDTERPTTDEPKQPKRNVQNVSSWWLNPNGTRNQTNRSTASSLPVAAAATAARIVESRANVPNVDSSNAKRKASPVAAAPSKNTKQRHSDDDANVQGDTAQVEDEVATGAEPPPDATATEAVDGVASAAAPLKQKKARVEIQEARKYGNKYLLQRDAPNGIMRLGGNAQRMYPSPRANHPRLQDLGDFQVVAYNDLWNPLAPQYAGQPSAAVGGAPDTDDPFAVFVRRSLTRKAIDAKSPGKLLGWEYCGQYEQISVDEIDEMYTSAKSVAPVCKKHMVEDMLKYPANFKRTYNKFCNMIDQALASDERQEQPETSLAARARALGYSPTMSAENLFKLIVELDEFHGESGIRFVGYDETIYNYVKNGVTNKDPHGKKAVHGNNAKSSDWYAFFDQQVEY